MVASLSAFCNDSPELRRNLPQKIVTGEYQDYQDQDASSYHSVRSGSPIHLGRRSGSLTRHQPISCKSFSSVEQLLSNFIPFYNGRIQLTFSERSSLDFELYLFFSNDVELNLSSFFAEETQTPSCGLGDEKKRSLLSFCPNSSSLLKFPLFLGVLPRHLISRLEPNS